MTDHHYWPQLDRIRTRSRQMYLCAFEYKAQFLDPIDWRPRGLNSGADHVAKCVLGSISNIDTLRNSDMLREVRNSTAIHIHCDGGFARGGGAAAYVVTFVQAS